MDTPAVSSSVPRRPGTSSTGTGDPDERAEFAYASTIPCPVARMLIGYSHWA